MVLCLDSDAELGENKVPATVTAWAEAAFPGFVGFLFAFCVPRVLGQGCEVCVKWRCCWSQSHRITGGLDTDYPNLQLLFACWSSTMGSRFNHLRVHTARPWQPSSHTFYLQSVFWEAAPPVRPVARLASGPQQWGGTSHPMSFAVDCDMDLICYFAPLSASPKHSTLAQCHVAVLLMPVRGVPPSCSAFLCLRISAQLCAFEIRHRPCSSPSRFLPSLFQGFPRSLLSEVCFHFKLQAGTSSVAPRPRPNSGR